MRQMQTIVIAALMVVLVITCGAQVVFGKPMPPRFFHFTYEFIPALQPGPVTLRLTLYDTTGCTDITAELFQDDNMGYSGPKTFEVTKAEQEPSVTIDLPVVLPQDDTCGFWMKFESSCRTPQWAGRFWVTGPDSVEEWTHDVRVYAVNTRVPEIIIDSSVQKWEDSLMANPSKPGRLVYYDEFGNETDQEGAIRALRNKANVMGYYPVPDGWVWVRDDTGGVYAISPEEKQRRREREQIEKYSSDIDPLDSTQAPLLDADGQTIQIHGEFWTRRRGERAFHKEEVITDLHAHDERTADSMRAWADTTEFDVILDLRNPDHYNAADAMLDKLEPTDSVGYYRTNATGRTLKQLRKEGIRDAEYPYFPRDPKDNLRRKNTPRPPKKTPNNGSGVGWWPMSSMVVQCGLVSSGGRAFDMPLEEQERRREKMRRIEQQPPERENLHSILIGDEEWLRFPKCRYFYKNDGLIIYEDNRRGNGFNDSLATPDGSVLYDVALDLRDPDRAHAVRGIVSGLAPMEMEGYFHALVISQKLAELRWRGIEYAEYPHYPISRDELMDRHAHSHKMTQLLPEDELRTVPAAGEDKTYLINPTEYRRACETLVKRDMEREPLERSTTQLVEVMGEQWIRYESDTTFQRAVALTEEEMRDPNGWYQQSQRAYADTSHHDCVLDLRNPAHYETASEVLDSLEPMEREGYYRVNATGRKMKEIRKAGIRDAQYPHYPLSREEKRRQREERRKKREQELREQGLTLDRGTTDGESVDKKAEPCTPEEWKEISRHRADSVRQLADTATHDLVLYLRDPEQLEQASRVVDSLVPLERAHYYRTIVKGDKLLRLREQGVIWDFYPKYPSPPPNER